MWVCHSYEGVSGARLRCQLFHRGQLFVMRPSIAKIADTFAPGAVASGFQVFTHQGFNVFFTKAILALNITKAHMIRERHLHDFADVFGGQVWLLRHIMRLSWHSAQCKPRPFVKASRLGMTAR